MSADDDKQRKLPNKVEQPSEEKSFLLRIIGQAIGIIALLVAAWLFSVVIEWLGMTFVWPEQGVMHSRDMITTELTYLNDGFKKGVLGIKPETFAIAGASSLDYFLFEWTHFRDFVAWAIHPGVNAGVFRITIARIVMVVAPYISAAINITQVFGIRLAVAVLSTPIFILFGTAAFIDGLVHRELRRYGGAHESSYVYHKVKPWIRPAFTTTWFIYLGAPFSIHPDLVFIPAACFFALAIFITTTMFKKYL